MTLKVDYLTFFCKYPSHKGLWKNKTKALCAQKVTYDIKHAFQVFFPSKFIKRTLNTQVVTFIDRNRCEALKK